MVLIEMLQGSGTRDQRSGAKQGKPLF